MNVNVNNNSQSPCNVISKYFSGSCVMDESLSEFKEKKATQTGPKNNLKPSGSKQANKRLKKPRGQKDIRTALKPKKSELVAYTRKFDEVCKQAGLDVDSEQLQLAIVLSKSLENNVNENCSSQHSLNLKDKTNRIRTTLQEYGFKIPEIKKCASKRQQKIRKNYKLLLASDNEKREIISNKYSQVLFAFGKQTSLLNSDHYDYTDTKLYYVATSICYRGMQNNDILYVENLIDKSVSSGNLLRDWSSIPGRAKSPDRSEGRKMDFSEIDCSQDELDVVLSGTLKSAKEVLRNKAVCFPKPFLIADDDHKANISIQDKPYGTESSQNIVDCIDHVRTPTKSNTVKDIGGKNSSITSENKRSTSPDLFDDEESVLNSSKNQDEIYSQLITSIFEDENDNESDKDIKQATDELRSKNLNYSNEDFEMTNSIAVREQITNNFTKRKSDDFMEITSCAKTNLDLKPYIDLTQESLKQCGCKSTMQLSQTTTDKTKRVSNDFMEITECVDNFNMPRELPHSIDLTQKSDDDNVASADGNQNNSQTNFPTNIDAEINLTKNSNKYKDYEYINDSECQNNISIISQTSSSNDELPIVCISGQNKHSPKDSNDTIIMNDDEINDVFSISNKPMANIDFVDEVVDLSKLSPYQKDKSNLKASQSFFDEFVHDHSDDIIEKNCSENNIDDNVDLTQSSSSTEIGDAKKVESVHKNILGNKYDVSVDYDELFDDVLEKSGNGSKGFIFQLSHVNNASGDHGIGEISPDISCNKSSSAIGSNEESKGSLNKSDQACQWENFGGISVLDTDENCKYTYKDQGKKSIEENVVNDNSLLPAVDIKRTTDCTETKSSIVTPIKDITRVIAAVTPSNEYIIKTDQVTPMLDYASMSSPERNRELDKYGLKPFKRKRAIQLLTYLYNQTHPIVQSCSEALEDQPAPPKKQRRNQPSPKKALKSSSSNRTSTDDQKENIYEITNDKPDIRPVECVEDDWVFQKREKTKMQSCRVPLHIAFHNYMSCRQRLREAILRYEPVNIDVIHKGLVSNGYRYDPKELLKFLDKKCITVKTADNNARNKKHY